MRGGLVSRFVEVDGVRWHHRVGGPLDAPPFVMVHGLVISSRYLVPLARRFGRTHRLYLPDVPGFGRSGDPPGEAWDVPRMAEGIARWMDAEGVPRAAFLGNSLGAQVVLELAALRPDRVSRTVLVGPTMDPEAETWAQAGRLLLDAPRERPLLVLEELRDLVACGPARAWATYRHALAHPVLERAPAVEAPTLVVRGTRDPIVPAAWARRIAAALPRGRFAEVEGPHALSYSAVERLEPVVRSFLAEDPPPAARAIEPLPPAPAWRRR